MGHLQNFDKDLKKRIDIEQKFADLIYKDFRTKRYGLSPCCSIAQMSKYSIKKQLCDWSDLKLETYCGIEYGLQSWSPGDEEEPWIEGSCENQCQYPSPFTPNEKQLGNKGGQYYKNYGGFAIYTSSSQGQKQEGTTDGRATYQSSHSVDDIMGIALDMDNGKFILQKLTLGRTQVTQQAVQLELVQ